MALATTVNRMTSSFLHQHHRHKTPKHLLCAYYMLNIGAFKESHTKTDVQAVVKSDCIRQKKIKAELKSGTLPSDVVK